MAKDFDNALSTRHISNELHNYESARTGFFVLVVHGLNGSSENPRGLLRPDYTGDPADADDSDYLRAPEEGLRLNVLKATVPHFSVGSEKFRRGNDVVKFATVPEWDDGEITVDDIVGLDTKSILMAWLYKAYNPHTRKGGRMIDYKKDCDLIEYTQDYEIVRTWHLTGVFVTKISEDNFDRENDGKRRLTASLSYDRATVELPDAQ